MKCIGIIKGEAKILDVENNLDSYCKLLDCRTIDITTRKIGYKYYDIICDDEGLLKESNIMSAIDSYDEPALVGSILICNFDTKGNEKDLTERDIQNIGGYILTFVDGMTGEEQDVVCVE